MKNFHIKQIFNQKNLLKLVTFIKRRFCVVALYELKSIAFTQFQINRAFLIVGSSNISNLVFLMLRWDTNLSLAQLTSFPLIFLKIRESNE